MGDKSTMSLASIQPFLILPLVFLTRGIDFTEPTKLLMLRVGFGLAQAVILGITFLIQAKINQKKGDEAHQKEIEVPGPKVPFSNEEPPVRKMTVYEYDMEKWNEALKQSLIQLAILGFFHYKWQAAVPLVTQFVMGPMKLYGSELFQIYIMGAKIERPFPAPKSPWGDMMKSFTGGGEEEEKPKPKKAAPIDSKLVKKNK